MITIAVTGGVATGKSTVVKLLQEKLGDSNSNVFDCDLEAHKLLTTPEIMATIAEEFGGEVLNLDGSINRSALRTLIFQDVDSRLKLEGLIHPKILNSALSCLSEYSSQADGPRYFILEIPLLYEVDFPIQRNLDVVVAASPKTQKIRLSENRKLDEQTINALLASQLSMQTKIDKADVVIWNEGEGDELTLEIELLSRVIKSKNLQTS